MSSKQDPEALATESPTTEPPRRVVRALVSDPSVVDAAAQRVGCEIEHARTLNEMLAADIALIATSQLPAGMLLPMLTVRNAGPVVIFIIDGERLKPSIMERSAFETPNSLDAVACALQRALRHFADRLIWSSAMGVIETSTEGFEFVDGQARLVHANPAWEAMTGYTVTEARGRTIANLLRSGAHSLGFYDAIWQAFQGYRGWSGEITSRTKSGTQFESLLRVIPPTTISGRPVGTACMRLPITLGDFEEDSVEGRVAASTSAELYGRLIDAANDGIFVLDAETLSITASNPAGLRIVDRSLDELRKLTFIELVPAHQQGRVERLVKQLRREGGAEVDRLALHRPDAPPIFASVRISSFVVRSRHLFVVVARDVTEALQREFELATTHYRLEQEQERSRLSARLATIGELAAGVAHEVNNPAGYVLLNLEYLRERFAEEGAPPRAEELAELLDESIHGMRRIGTITRELLPFARDADSPVRPLFVGEEVKRALRLVDNEVRHRAALKTAIGGVPPVLARAGRISQLVTNLVVNAVHSFIGGGPNENRITVSLEEEEEGVVLRVSDTGRGIPPEHRERIFEPFFTTKEAGRGTGLGLSLCAEIAFELGGEISVTSRIDHGTTFRVWLPISDEQPSDETAGKMDLATDGTRHRLLIIDDEPQLVLAQARLLRHTFDVEEAVGGQAALNFLEKDGGFDAILCDLMMPDVDGLAIYQAIARDHPSLCNRIVFQSGGVFQEHVTTFLESIDNPILPKPTPRRQLIETLQRIASAS